MQFGLLMHEQVLSIHVMALILACLSTYLHALLIFQYPLEQSCLTSAQKPRQQGDMQSTIHLTLLPYNATGCSPHRLLKCLLRMHSAGSVEVVGIQAMSTHLLRFRHSKAQKPIGYVCGLCKQLHKRHAETHACASLHVASTRNS